MNKKEKAFLGTALYENALRYLRADADMKNNKNKQNRIMANAAKIAFEEAEYISKHLGIDIKSIKEKAQEDFELQKG